MRSPYWCDALLKDNKQDDCFLWKMFLRTFYVDSIFLVFLVSEARDQSLRCPTIANTPFNLIGTFWHSEVFMNLYIFSSVSGPVLTTYTGSHPIFLNRLCVYNISRSSSSVCKGQITELFWPKEKCWKVLRNFSPYFFLPETLKLNTCSSDC